MSFEAIISADTLATYVDVLRTIVDEAKLHVDEDGLRTKAGDPANVAMQSISLDAAAFESYEADGGVLGVNLGRLDDVVGMASAGELVHLELDEETRKLQIAHGGLSYTLALIDPDSIRAEPDIPELDLSTHLVLEGRHLSRGAKAADLVSDHIEYRSDADETAFIIAAEGDTDDTELAVGQEDLIQAQIPEAEHSLLSLDYVKDLLKPIDDDTEVTIELGTEFPVKWHYEFATGHGEVTSMLAPRIQSD